MPIMPGFTGVMRFYRTGQDPFDFYMRFNTAKVDRQQTVEMYLPVYAGIDIRQIIRTSTVDHSANVSGPLTEGKAAILYEMARFRKDRLFDVDMFFYSDPGNSNAKTITNCFISDLQFRCVAGDVVVFTMNFLGTGSGLYAEDDMEYTVGEKLVTWDKTGIVGAYDDDLVNGFSYTIQNSPVTIKTGQGLHPRDINPTIQEVRGDISVYNLRRPYAGSYAYDIGVREVTFHIEDWTDTHKIAFDPRQETPLNAGAVISRISWVRVDDFD